MRAKSNNPLAASNAETPLFLRGGAHLGVDPLALGLGHPLDLSWVIRHLGVCRPAGGILRLLEREADPAPTAIGLQHPHPQVLSDLDDVLGVLDVLPGELRDVEQPLDAVADLEEGTVLLDLGDLALDDRPRRKPLFDVVPGVLAELAQAEGDARGVGVELDDLDPHVLTDLEDVGNVRHAVPGELGDVDQAVGGAQVDESAVGGQAGDFALDLIADLELLEELAPLACPVLVEGSLLADDQPVALAVDLEDFDADPLTDQLLEVRAVGTRHLRGRQEAAQPEDVDDQATLVLLADLGVHHLAGRLLLLGLDPDRLGARTAQRQDDVAVLVFGLQDEDLDVVTGVKVGRSRLTRSQLAAGDYPLGFRADIDQNFIGIDPNDDPIDDVAVG